MSWYYHITTGEISEGTGWRKWSMDREIDIEKIQAKVGIPQMWFGPFATQAQAQTFKAAHPSAAEQVHSALGAAGNAVSDVTGAITGVGNQLVKLSVRLAEAAAGIVLLAIALNVILKQSTGVDVAAGTARAAKRAGKTAAAAAVL